MCMWEAAHAPGSPFLVFASAASFAHSLEGDAILWSIAVRQGVKVGQRAKAKRKLEQEAKQGENP